MPSAGDRSEDQAAPPPRPGPVALYRQREYMLLWGALVAGTLGAGASGIIYPILILALTGSPAQASAAAALRLVPYLLLSLPVGALIDRWDRRRTMIAAQAGRALAVAAIPLALWTGHLTVELLYCVAVVEGALHVFFNIAETAAIPRVVAAAQLPQATAQNQAGFAASGIVGPALGTWLYQAAGRAWPFVVDVLAHLGATWAIWRLRTSFAPQPPTQAPDLRAEVTEGLRWLWHQKLVRDMSLLTGTWNFVAAAVPLFVIVRAKELGASEAQIGLAFSCGGVGAIVGALIGGQIQRRFSFGQVIAGTLILHALLFPLFALATTPMALGAVYAATMLLGPVYNVVQFSHRIALIPDGLQGRVNSSFRLIAHGLIPVGALLGGQLLEHAGSVWTIAFFTLVSIGIAAAAALNREVRHAPTLGAAATAQRR